MRILAFLAGTSLLTGIASAAPLPQWPAPVSPPQGAPNIVVILVDDVGFGATATFGGPIDTPNFTSLAQSGVGYNNFHVNALCSPTRASLLSGYNSHQTGFGDIAESASPYPGYNTQLPPSITPLPETLRRAGYNTAAFGKWHNTPTWQVGPAGPFDLWPTGRWGFDHFYGFLRAADNQYAPRLYRDRTPVEPDRTAAQGYNFTNDITNDAIAWLHQHDAAAPNKPFFLYYATGATHEPHQVATAWADKYRGRFDRGWDVLRREAFDTQKKQGIIPQNADFVPRPDGLPAWDSLAPDEKRLLARQAEVYAGFAEQTDHEIGRLLTALREEGHGSDTIVIEIFGDNGASAEGGLTGHDARDSHGKPLSVAVRAAQADRLGGELVLNHYAAAWAWALSSPFPGTKQDASHLGGVTDPMVIAWSGHVPAGGTIRPQFGHLIDIAPTLYEIAHITPARVTDGTPQLPLPGTSLAYSFDHPEAPSRHHVQYFATSANRGIYADGWWAGDLARNTWDTHTSPFYFDDDNGAPHTHAWELYHLDADYAQAHDLAAQAPEKLAQLQALFAQQAAANQVRPLHPHPVPYPTGADTGRRDFTYRGGVNRIASPFGPAFGRLPYRITARIVVPARGANGVIFADGGRFGGLSLFLGNGHPVLATSSAGNATGTLRSDADLAPGPHILTATILPDAPHAAGQPRIAPGTITLAVDNGPAARVHTDNLMPGWGETIDIGADLGTPVSPDYAPPNHFPGQIDTVHVEQIAP